MKAIIVVDFAYKSPKRSGRGTGHTGLRSVLQYFQYRDRQQHAFDPADAGWQDRGLGDHHRAIHRHCDALQSPHVLAWTWVISPDPALLTLVPAAERAQLVRDLTERVVEDYYLARGFDVPEFAYILHHRSASMPDGTTLDHLHSHVVLPGTAPSMADRLPVYNNVSKGDDRLFRDVATAHFAHALDERGIDWQRERTLTPELDI